MPLVLAAAVISAAVAAAIMWGASRIASELSASRQDTARGRALDLLTMFAPAASAAAENPKAVLVWEPLARTARQLFPEPFAHLDRAAGGSFPFGPERIQEAHAQWTADWLAWEGAHDAEFKSKAAAIEEELAGAGAGPAARARFAAVEREKLERYQRRYQEYIRVAKALQQLTT